MDHLSRQIGKYHHGLLYPKRYNEVIIASRHPSVSGDNNGMVCAADFIQGARKPTSSFVGLRSTANSS